MECIIIPTMLAMIVISPLIVFLVAVAIGYFD